MSTRSDTCECYKAYKSTGCTKSGDKKLEIQEKTMPSPSNGVNSRCSGTDGCLPLLSGQSFQSHPPGHWHMFLGELSNEGVRNALAQEETTMGANHHTLLTPREHDVRSSLVLHEPWTRGSDDRDDDMIFFVSLEGVDVEYRVFPGETRGLQRVFDRVSLSVVGSDDLELLPFLNVTPSNLYGGFDLSFVLNDG